MNTKFSIGIVIAIVLQVSGFVWWIAQQSQTIETLKGEVAELTARSEVEKEVTLINDVEQIKKDIKELSDKALEAILELEQDRIDGDDKVGSHVDTKVDNLGSYVDNRFNVLIDELNEEFIKYDTDIDDLEIHIDIQIEGLDKKLSDRIEDIVAN